MKYDVIVTDAEDILDLEDLQYNFLGLDDISEEELKHIVDIFGSRAFRIVLFPRLGSEE